MVAANQNRSFVMDCQCWKCGNIISIIINKEDFVDWTSGSSPIEKVLDYLSANERELLISNTCGTCFDNMFSGLDNAE
ncbi:MAG: hypothetical protein EBU08_18300 [Micrococcales bacterium]|nr:hypothetical protein [Micrococcales bacterium]